MSKKKGMKLRCNHCSYQWAYTGELQKPTCPSCKNSVTLKIRQV